MSRILFIGYVIAHGLVHLAIWLMNNTAAVTARSTAVVFCSPGNHE